MLTRFFERLYFNPEKSDWLFILLLSPFSFIYGFIMSIRRFCRKPKHYPVPIISIGNLIIGGSGKTPFSISLLNKFPSFKTAYISRGYGRKSSGLKIVNEDGEILCGVEESGDEAMLLAKYSPDTLVIVSEERTEAINYALKYGCQLIILDDGFNRVEIEKFEILLEPSSVRNPFPLPAGPWREFRRNSRFADLVLKENIDFFRKVTYENLSEKMMLVTAIGNPERLNPWLPEGVVKRLYLPDHSYFDEKKIKEIMLACEAETILTTEKDLVKMQNFTLPVSVMKLQLEIDSTAVGKIEMYIESYREH